MKFSKKIIFLTAAALAVCMTLASCSAQKEDNGVAYEKEMKISTAADLEGKAVAVQLRSAEDDYIVNNKLTNYPKRYENMSDAVQALIDKKVAAVVVDSHYANQLTDGVEGVRIIENSIGSVEYRFLLNKSDAKLAEKMNQQVKGLLVATSDGVAYGCGGKLDTMTVDPVTIDDTSSANEGEVTSFVSNEAQTIKGKKNAFCVVTSEAKDDDTVFVTTDSFYTSELVMIVRTEEQEKK